MHKLKLIPLIATALLASPVFAWDCHKWSQSSDPRGECYRAPKAQSLQGGKASSASKSKAAATAASNSVATANSVADSSNAGVTTTFDHEEVRQTPPAFLGYVEPTTSCANARNGGASSPFAALSLGFSTKDKECDLRETARLFYEMGQPDIAVTLLCKSEAAKRLPTCEFKETQATSIPDYPTGERERRQRARGFPVGK